MEKLLRLRYGAVALVMAICLVLMVLILPRFPDKICTLPFWVLILSEYVFAIIVLICVQFQSLRQSLFNFQLAPALVSVGLAFLVCAVGIVVSPMAKLEASGMISIGLAQLTTMNLAILFSILAIP